LNPIKLTIQIKALNELNIDCYIFNEQENNQLEYRPLDGTCNFKNENQLATTIRNNKHQFEKVIRSAIKGDIKIGQIINCVFLEGYNFLNDDDFTRIIRLDMRNGGLDISTSSYETKDIHKIYADGSFICETKQSGFGGFIEDPTGNQEIFFRSFNEGSSNLMELLAVSEGLLMLQSVKKLQVNTDSRYVIRGLVQWVHFWKHNNWQTAYSTDVKDAKYWQNAYRLCENKFIEFKWIKGHSGNSKQDFCHQLAKESINR